MIRITTRPPGPAVVTFPYDAEAVAIIKTIAGRRWDATTKRWTIPRDAVRLAATRLHDAGFTVSIDDTTFEPGPPSSSNGVAHPIDALFHVLPERLRPPVYKALARVLHPDAGGDLTLMQQLNRAHEEIR